ncbi:MAG: large conductance mechanosensitive channel protein MscL [Candidatus Saccharimonadales bacterium]
MLKDFKKFITHGNAVDLAVAVVVGAAFGAVVTAMVKDLLTPLIAAIAGQPDFSALTFTINGSNFMYGNFLNALIAFLSVAAAVFFFVVQPINKLQELSKRNKTADDPTDQKCPECLSTIPKKARRCMYCTSVIKASK